MARIGADETGTGAVHAARHAGIDAFLQRDLRADARAIGGEILGESENRQSEFLHAGVEMAIAAGEVVARKALRGVGHVRPDMGISRGDEIAPVADQPAMRVVRQRVDLRNRPEFRARRAKLFGGGGRREQERRERGSGQILTHGLAQPFDVCSSSDHRYLLGVASGNFHLPFSASVRGL